MRRGMLIAAVVLSSTMVLGWWQATKRVDREETTASSDREPPREQALRSSPRFHRSSSPADATRAATPPSRVIAPAPSGTTVVHGTVASELSALYQDWSDERFAELFDVAASPEALEELFDWYRAHLGRCEGGFEVLASDRESRVRYGLACELGLLELEPAVGEDGKIRGMRSGARGLSPPSAVRLAAEGASALLETWDERSYLEIFAATFVEEHPPEAFRSFLDEVTDEHGPCPLGRLDLANPRGAIYFLRCTRGHRIMVLDLDDDDRISRFLIRPPRALHPAPGPDEAAP